MIEQYAEFLYLHPLTSYVFLGVFFVCIGSFLNVVIVRLPLMLHIQQERISKITLKLPVNNNQQFINLITPRSYCCYCKTTIPFWQNIPLLSFIFLRGKCANCSQAISFMYPLVEFLCLALSICAVYFLGFGWHLIYILGFIWVILCLIFIDLRTQLLPDSLTLLLLWLGLLANIDGLYTSLPQAINGAIAAYLSLWVFINIYYWLTGKIGMGGGDFKLFAALGAWFGVTSLPYILVAASIPGIIFGGGYLLISGKSRDTPIPFGPFLGLAGLVFIFFFKAHIPL